MYSVSFFLNIFFTIIVLLLGKYESDYTIEFTVAMSISIHKRKKNTTGHKTFEI